VAEALSAVRNRNGKPYGAAGAVAELLHTDSSLVFADKETEQLLNEFLENDLPKLILSPSSSQLVDILYCMSESSNFKAAWTACLKKTLTETDSPKKATVLEAILTSPRIPSEFHLASSDSELQAYVKSSVRAALQGLAEWDSFSRILQSPSQIISESTTDDILSFMTQSLSVSEEAPSALQGFRHIIKQSPSVLKSFLSSEQGSTLLQELLLASESPSDNIAQEATAINSSIQTLLSAGSDSKGSIFDVIQRGLREASSTSVSVETLIDLAKRLVKPGDGLEDVVAAFPAIEDWHSALAPFLDTAPRSSLAITNPLGGGVYLVAATTSASQTRKISRDSDGYSAAYRIAQYIVKVFRAGDIFPIEEMPSDVRAAYLRTLALTLELASDNLGLASANNIWAAYNPEVENEAISFISEAQTFVTEELKQLGTSWAESNATSSLLSWATELLDQVESGNSAKAYYTARAYGVLVSNAIEFSGWNKSHTQNIQDSLRTLRRSKGTFLSAVRGTLANKSLQILSHFLPF
jgi:hypothetical protein